MDDPSYDNWFKLLIDCAAETGSVHLSYAMNSGEARGYITKEQYTKWVCASTSLQGQEELLHELIINIYHHKLK